MHDVANQLVAHARIGRFDAAQHVEHLLDSDDITQLKIARPLVKQL